MLLPSGSAPLNSFSPISQPITTTATPASASWGVNTRPTPRPTYLIWNLGASEVQTTTALAVVPFHPRGSRSLQKPEKIAGVSILDSTKPDSPQLIRDRRDHSRHCSSDASV